jgi:hypothetical protein
MDDVEAATQQVARELRRLKLLHFRFMQLRHTNDQLLAGLRDLIARAGLIDQMRLVPRDDSSPPFLGEEPPS